MSDRAAPGSSGLYWGMWGVVLGDLGAALGCNPPLWVPGIGQKIFMQDSDASNFLKKRSRRSPKSQDEVNGETRAGIYPLSPCPSPHFLSSFLPLPPSLLSLPPSLSLMSPTRIYQDRSKGKLEGPEPPCIWGGCTSHLQR